MAGPALDDRAAVAAADPGGMLSLVAGLGEQLRTGFELGRSAPALPSGEGLRSIVVCGMGGSGVAGDVLRSLFAARLPQPILVVKGYALPEFCRRDSLAMVVSYSGDTEETVATYAQAVAAGCRVVSMSAGGELAALAEADDVAHIGILGDVPVPRAALGSLAGAAIGVLHGMGLIPPVSDDVARSSDLLDSLAAELGPAVPTEENGAKSLATWLGGRTPVVWSSEGLGEAAGLRWKTQFNENAKVPAFHAVIPELDHNEVEGWSKDAGTSFGAIALRHRGEHPRVADRLEATIEAVAGSGLDSTEVWAAGSTPMESLFSLIATGDYATTYLAILRGVDPTPVPVLAGLKERLRP